MLIQIGRFRFGTQLFKQCLFYSTAKFDEFHAEKCIVQPDDNLPSRAEECIVQPDDNLPSRAEECIVQPDDNLPSHAEGTKFLKVAILGLPNTGKSTLINALVQRPICPTSSKAHTTTYKANAIYSEGDTQIVFMDTPGFASKNEMIKFELSKAFKKDPVTSIIDADIIGVLQDATNVYTRHTMTRYMVNDLNKRKENTPVILIFNKVDKLTNKKILLELVTQLQKNKYIPKFDDIFMISALTGDGVDDLRNYLLDSAKKNKWQYEQNLYTDQSPESIVKQTVRAKLLDLLPTDMPYVTEVDVQHYDVSKDGRTMHTKNSYRRYYPRVNVYATLEQNISSPSRHLHTVLIFPSSPQITYKKFFIA
ncbi:GTPase Era, mitochondrial isoform X2 [Nomia melanderi]|uniref:GTPase Era, mitochondrial isoform X2 n=1 Tax=Nomia melanderi TaxID=2448451 RepID=UPI003FCE5DBD